MKNGKINNTVYTNNSFINSALKTKKVTVHHPYPYSYETWKNNYGARRDLLSDRILYWLEKHPVSGKPMTLSLFTSYVNSFSRRTGITFSQACINGYVRNKYCPKSDRINMLALAMGVSVAWLEGYGPKVADFAPDMGTLNRIISQNKANKQARTRKATETRIRKRTAA